MLGHIFYHSLIRKYVALFGTMFNDIVIVKQASADQIPKTIHVPISYGPREKTMARLEGDPALNKQPAIQLPRMSFELRDFQYDPARKLTTTGKNFALDSDNQPLYQYNAVPYNLAFTLAIYAKDIDDCWRIVEQILPFFTPDFTLKATLVPEMQEARDISIIIDQTQLQDVYEGNFEDRRVIVAEFTFTMKAWLYGPVRDGALIDRVTANIFNASPFDTIDEAIDEMETPTVTITVSPGQTANGQATTNSALTIDRSLISPDSDYGFITTSNTNPNA